MTSDHDRHVLDGIERRLRVSDPELCDRLGRAVPSSDPARGRLERLVGTRALTGWIVALVLSVLLGLLTLAMLLFAVVIICLSVRASRTNGEWPQQDPRAGLFGPPPYGPV